MVLPKYQVFISSTYEDLRKERDQVIKAVLEMGHIPVGMEMFSAADEEQWRIITRHIEESDYYVVLVAHRYGSVTEEGISYTRKEYEYARSKEIPCLGFLLEDEASWPSDRVDKEGPAVEALADFKTLIREKPVSTWTSVDDLYGKVSISLMKAITGTPRVGWIRASDTAGPELLAELARLSSENADLRKAVEYAEESNARSQQEKLEKTIEIMIATIRKPSYRYERRGPWQRDSEVSLFGVYQTLATSMMVEGSVMDMAKTLALQIRADREQRADIVAVNQLRGLLADLMTLDLVRPSTQKHAVSDENEYWTLTGFGTDLLKHMRRISLVETEGIKEAEDSDEGSDSDDLDEEST